jgi:hypothetical protein
LVDVPAGATHDRERWLRDRRAELYVDVLTEAHAEREYFDYDIADDETRERKRRNYVDLRLPPFERARLGARGTAFASRNVNRLFNHVQSEALDATWRRPQHEGERAVARVRVGGAFGELEAAIRRELDADSIDRTTP